MIYRFLFPSHSSSQLHIISTFNILLTPSRHNKIINSKMTLSQPTSKNNKRSSHNREKGRARIGNNAENTFSNAKAWPPSQTFNINYLKSNSKMVFDKVTIQSIISSKWEI